MKQLVDEMDASASQPGEQQEEAAEEQPTSPGSTHGRSPSRRGTCAKRKWSGIDHNEAQPASGTKRLRRCRSSSADSSDSSSLSNISSLSSDASRSLRRDAFSDSSSLSNISSLSSDASRSPRRDAFSDSSSLSNISSLSSDASRSPRRDAFSDNKADLNPSSSSSDSKEEARRGVPAWDASERYPEMLEPENWQKEEEPLGSDAEEAFDQFKHEFDKYKAKDRVGAPFWEELRSSVPSFGFDRAREEKFFVGYDEDGREVRYTDERFMERRIRESQVLEYQAECRRLLEEQEQYAKEQEQQAKEQEQQQQRTGAAERSNTMEERKQRREQVSYMGERKSVWWKAGFRGVDVELKKVALENDQVVCVVGNRSRRGAKLCDEEGVTR